MSEPQATQRGIQVSFPQLDIPHLVRADRTRVKQILINLLSNAIKYNRVGGTVHVDCTTSMPGRIRISIRDTGEGLTAGQIAQLFQPFNRLGQETRTGEGTGIGLVVSKRLVELMGGSISVESTVGVGSMFWIELSQTAEHGVIEPGEAASISQLQGYDTVPLRTLLYVEDNPANLMLVEDIMGRRPDIRLISARDGLDGIDRARALCPDLILMDINLPGMSGVEALRLLHKDPLTAHIPVVALSANASPRDMSKGLEAGFVHYLTKPIKVDELLNTLDAAFKSLDLQTTAA
jgi:CheY-like chemotaxis protein